MSKLKVKYTLLTVFPHSGPLLVMSPPALPATRCPSGSSRWGEPGAGPGAHGDLVAPQRDAGHPLWEWPLGISELNTSSCVRCNLATCTQAPDVAILAFLVLKPPGGRSKPPSWGYPCPHDAVLSPCSRPSAHHEGHSHLNSSDEGRWLAPLLRRGAGLRALQPGDRWHAAGLKWLQGLRR